MRLRSHLLAHGGKIPAGIKWVLIASAFLVSKELDNLVSKFLGKYRALYHSDLDGGGQDATLRGRKDLRSQLLTGCAFQPHWQEEACPFATAQGLVHAILIQPSSEPRTERSQIPRPQPDLSWRYVQKGPAVLATDTGVHPAAWFRTRSRPS